MTADMTFEMKSIRFRNSCKRVQVQKDIIQDFGWASVTEWVTSFLKDGTREVRKPNSALITITDDRVSGIWVQRL